MFLGDVEVVCASLSSNGQMMNNSGGEETKRARAKLRALYFEEGEEALRKRRDELERQWEKASGKRERAERFYKAACAAVRSAQQLIELYDRSSAFGSVHFFADPTSPICCSYDIHGNVDDWSSGYWWRGEAHVVAVTEDDEEVFRVRERAPLEELYHRAQDERRRLKEELADAGGKVERLDVWYTVCDDLVREAVTDSIPETRHEVQGAARKATQETSTPAGWKKNAAMMHAYFSNNGAPANLGDVDEVIAEEGLLDSFSHDHTWRKLKEEGWASSEGNIQALVEALERWAEHFEEKHGEEEADWAAGGFNWPSHHNTG